MLARAARAACAIVVEPDADVLHDYVLERPDRRKEYYLERNRLIFVLTAFSGRLLLLLAPVLLAVELGIALARAPAGLAAREGARLGLARRATRRGSRRAGGTTQALRRVPDRELARFLTPVLDPRMLELLPGVAVAERPRLRLVAGRPRLPLTLPSARERDRRDRGAADRRSAPAGASPCRDRARRSTRRHNIGRVIDELRAFDPGSTSSSWTTARVDGTAHVAAAKGARVLRLPFNLGIGGAVQTGFRFAFENDYDIAVRVDGDGQHDPAQLGRVLEPVLRGDADIVVGSRFAADGASRLPLVALAPRRHPAARLGRLAHRRPARDRHDVGLPGAEPRGHRALRARLPARLPGGRGDGDGLPPPPAPHRGAGRDARARRRPLVDHGAPLDLLHGQGAARDLRRALSPQRRPAGGIGMTPLAVSIAGAIASFVLVLVVLELIRSRRLRERYALLWLVTGIVLTVLSAWRDGLNTIAGWLGVRSYPPAVLFAVGLLFILAVLLHYSTVISRLSDQNVLLAQRLALLEQELRASSRASSAPS